MWLKWLPWKFMVRKIARAHGLTDPIRILSYIHRFSQPAEVLEPIELLRAGVVFHTRGLLNSRAIQHNLDWLWPFWVQRQFNPLDPSFVPRAFSLTHINMTHRNWTAVGIPDCNVLPIIDPCGLLTPFWDGWSLDAWVYTDDGELIAPTLAPHVTQRLDMTENLEIVTAFEMNQTALESRARVEVLERRPLCDFRVTAHAARPGWLVIALRPYNPEGVSFIHSIEIDPRTQQMSINDKQVLGFDRRIDTFKMSTYTLGDVSTMLGESHEHDAITCDVGMATAAAMIRLEPGREQTLTASIPLYQKPHADASYEISAKQAWKENLAPACLPDIFNSHLGQITDAALRALILHTPGDVYPGPFTYKRFWFRDACFILYAMLCAGLSERAESLIRHFLPRQKSSGYFYSQEGEWDSNGQVLWLLGQLTRFTNRPIHDDWLTPIEKAARWIIKKRTAPQGDTLHAGLLPAGFSAEHLGPNDYYYWDDFWSVAGLEAAADLMRGHGRDNLAREYDRQARDLLECIEKTLDRAAERLGTPAMPASPYRRLDSGAVGSIAAGYPLRLYGAENPRLRASIDYLIERHFVRGGFFQDMIHSGINPYLTLHIAQNLLRFGDTRFIELVETVANMASPTGQWPEAVHPQTLGGCMGDGQHIWACAEWLVMIRNCLVYEEPLDNRLVLGAGLYRPWFRDSDTFIIEDLATLYGPLSMTVRYEHDHIHVDYTPQWYSDAPRVRIAVPGTRPRDLAPNEHSITLVSGESA